VATSFKQIKPEFERLRAFVLNDLDRIVDRDVGGNYAAVALIVCGHDAIADLRDGRANAGQLPFADALPSAWRPVAPSL